MKKKSFVYMSAYAPICGKFYLVHSVKCANKRSASNQLGIYSRSLAPLGYCLVIENKKGSYEKTPY